MCGTVGLSVLAVMRQLPAVGTPRDEEIEEALDRLGRAVKAAADADEAAVYPWFGKPCRVCGKHLERRRGCKMGDYADDQIPLYVVH